MSAAMGVAGMATPPILQPVVPTPIPSFQDIDSDSDDSATSEDPARWKAAIAAAKAAFTDEQVDAMMHFLQERGLFAFVTRFVDHERIPIPTLLLAFNVLLPPGLVSLGDQLRVLKIACSRVLRNREKLTKFNTVDDAVRLIARSKKILVLTGAGVSTSCGIPDFRSPTGLYARLKEEHWELEDPQEMFDLTYFKEKPNVFYSFAKEIYPSNFVPSPCHRFARLLELNHKLLRNYTQNIDGLFERVGCTLNLNCHGSFASASCLLCRTHFPGSAIEADVFASRVPLCPLCTPKLEAMEREREKEREAQKVPEKWDERKNGKDDQEEEEVHEWRGKALVKPDIVFFGEMLSDEFDRRLLEDREEVDLLIVIGTSLRVSPVAQIVSHLPHSVPQILINRDPISHANFDIQLLGDGDTIVRYLCDRLAELGVDGEGAWDLDARVPALAAHHEGGEEEGEGKGEGKGKEEEKGEVVPERVAESHVWLFPGANGGRWVEAVRRAYGDTTDEDEEVGGRGGLGVPEMGNSRSRTRSPDSEEDGSGEGAKKVRVV